MSQIVVRPMQWAELPDMNAMNPRLDDADAACLAALRIVLEQYGKLNRFGINLLHKHFEIADDECLLETIDVENRTLMVRPVPRAEMPSAVETQWNLASRNPLQWCEVYCQRLSNGDHRNGHQKNISRDD